MEFAFWDDWFNQRLDDHIAAQEGRAAPALTAEPEAQPAELPTEARAFVVLSFIDSFGPPSR